MTADIHRTLLEIQDDLVAVDNCIHASLPEIAISGLSSMQVRLRRLDELAEACKVQLEHVYPSVSAIVAIDYALSPDAETDDRNADQ